MAARWVCLLVAVVGVVAWVEPSEAAPRHIGVGEVHAEADVADEAGAVTLLVHSALVGEDVTIGPPPADLTLQSRDQIGAANLSHALLMELSREGTGLRLTLAILGADGSRDIEYVRAGDGDVARLAQSVVDRVATECQLDKKHQVPPVSLGALRPYAAALRLKATPADAATALADALPRTALTVPAISKLLGGLAASTTDQVQAVIVARALRDNKRLNELAGGTDATAVAAKVLVAMVTSNRTAATEALGPKPDRSGLVQLAQVVMAESGSDKALFESKVKDALVTDQVRPVLAIAASMESGSLSPALHKALVTAAEKLKMTTGATARIGLNAAEAGIEVNRALALVSARELDSFDLDRLDKIVAKRTDKISLRLRAELSMCRADGLESAAIHAYFAAAPTEVQAHRYQGWALAAEGKYSEAGAELAKAGAKSEQARALLAAGDPRAALFVIGSPKSAEELVIAAHVALLDKQPDQAATTIALAEKQSPVNPAVHRVIVALDAVKPDPARVAVSKAVLEAASSSTGTAKTIAVGSGSGGAAAETRKVQLIEVKASIDPSHLALLLAPFDELLRLKKHTLKLAEVRWEPPWYSFHETHSELVEGGLIKTLQSAPYRLKIVREPQKQTADFLDATQVADLTADSDAVLLYKVAIKDGAAAVTLTLYLHDATEGKTNTDTIKAPGIVSFNGAKLRMILIFAGVIVFGLLVYILRAKGRIKLKLIKAPDVSDEVLCVEISKSPTRPRIGDPTKFHKDTKAAGTVVKAESATLIVSGQTFKVGVGQWYVHVYGTFVRAGKLMVVPASCTKEVVLSRGDLAELDFELTSKLAEVRVEVIANPRRGVVVWVQSAPHDKTYTDDEGVALLMLPVGTHDIIIEAKSQRFERQLQITTLKQQILSLNIERELRLGQGLAIDLGADTKKDAKSEIVNPPPPRVATSAPVAASTPLAAATPVATMPMVSAPSTPPQGTRARAQNPLASAITDFSPDLSQPAPAANRAHPRARTPLPGELLLGRYRITAELGRGAMGVVHRARDEKLERDVAIKEMADDLRTNKEAMRLFEQEAKALAQLNHTNIVAMYDQVTDMAGVYMIMEFVDGTPLANMIETKGALPWRDAVGIVDQVLAGLAYAHARKVIHRDIKPANIFVAHDRTVKLGDFGLARVMREVTIKRTEIRGTPLYMAPEQITGTNVDHRADLYATGCMLFELVTGRPPFIDGDILYAQMHLPPPSASSMAELPPALDELITSLLAKGADDRPGSANEVRAALKSLYG